jgi:hypothetical protein
VGQDSADDGTGADHSQAKALVRPTFTQRANKRFPFVLGAFLILNLVQVLKSGFSGWGALGAFLASAYGAVIAAAAVTLLLAMFPGKPRQLS